MRSRDEKDTALGLYSARIAARVARVQPQTFQAWIKADLIRPQKFVSGKRSENTYTYDDLLLMRLIVRLKEQGASTKSIRAALDTVEYMCEGNRAAWKQVEMSVSSDLVVVMIPGIPNWNPVAASEGPQKMVAVFFPELIAELQNELVPPDRFRGPVFPPVPSCLPLNPRSTLKKCTRRSLTSRYRK